MHGHEMLPTLSASHRDRMLQIRRDRCITSSIGSPGRSGIREAGTGRNGNRPERTTYELTDAGADALTLRPHDLVASPVDEFEKFVVALAEIHHLDISAAVQPLNGRIGALERSAAEFGRCAMRTRCPVGAARWSTCWRPRRRSSSLADTSSR